MEKEKAVSNFSISGYQIKNGPDVGVLTVEFILLEKHRTPQMFAEFMERISQLCAQYL